jgi:hypothetical protein
MSLTTDPNDPRLNKPKEDGQHEVYLVLSEEERAKGFIRPFRNKYIHVGRKIEQIGIIKTLEESLVDCSDFAKGHYTKENGYVAYLKYPESDSPVIGRFIKQNELDAFNSHEDYLGGCGVETKMGKDLSETYARDPKFYGATFCVGCGKHLPVNEFVWSGTSEEVGS